MTRSCLRLLVTALALASMPAAAEIYKWTDEDGVRHYSQQPPPQGTRGVTRMDTGGNAVGGVQSGSDAPATGDDPEAETAQGEGKAETEGEEETLAEFCQGLREDLEVLESDRPVKVKSDEGTLRPMGEEERAQRLAQTREQIERNCQDEDGDTG